MRSKRAALGEQVMMLYRLILISLTAFIVFGVGSLVYDYDVQVHDAEAAILIRSIYDCLAPGATIELMRIDEDDRDTIMSYCGFENSQRYYVGAYIYDSKGKSFLNLSHGRKDDLWVIQYYDSIGDSNKGKSLDPGYKSFTGPVRFVGNGQRFEGKMTVEVLVKNEG